MPTPKSDRPHPQDQLLKDAVRLLDEALNRTPVLPNGQTANWSWLSEKSGVSTTTLRNWRMKRTRCSLTRTIEATLKVIGKRLEITDR